MVVRRRVDYMADADTWKKMEKLDLGIHVWTWDLLRTFAFRLYAPP